MFVQVKAGNDTKAGESRQAEIAGIVEASLGRFGDQLTSVEVFISDENGRAKQGGDDKRCLIEARLAGMQPIAVQTHAATFEEAVADCSEKLERTLDRRLGRLDDRGGRAPMSGAETPVGDETPAEIPQTAFPPQVDAGDRPGA
jgi:hypothetical protein